MDSDYIIDELERNGSILNEMLGSISNDMKTWRPAEGKWCLLEICCHLYDEEREDFRARTKHVLENPGKHPPKFDPLQWVTERTYMEQDYEKVRNNFISERAISVSWLRSLENPQWQNAFLHPKFGAMSAGLFLTNWLAHDYLHIRQIQALKYQYLAQHFGVPLNYAGDW